MLLTNSYTKNITPFNLKNAICQSLNSIGSSIDKAYVAISGGLDSTVLLHALVQEFGNERFQACHFNHQLRGEDSKLDELHVRELCEKLGVNCSFATANVCDYAKAKKESIETVARQVRFDFFASLARQKDINAKVPKVILAHHADDQAETILMNIMRGSGTNGLAGMQLVTEQKTKAGNFIAIRPLLNIRRSELIHYAKENRLIWREDISNLNNNFFRNKIRNKILPQISKHYGRDVAKSLLKFSEIAKTENDFFYREVDDFFLQENLCKENSFLPTKCWLKKHKAIQRRIVFAWLSANEVSNVTLDLVNEIIAIANPKSKTYSVNLAMGRRVRRKSGKLIYCKQ